MPTPGELTAEEIGFLRRAVELAGQAERSGNLPIGALITLDGMVIATGRNAIWKPKLDLTRHAEMDAMRSVPSELWPRSRRMTLYTTLEPCVMCAGAILLHHFGRVMFGSTDPQGGVASCLSSLPPYFRQEFSAVEWIGPALPAVCDPMYERVREIERRREATDS